tara:strand:- start:9929 stop:10486 length:558 start_codon:yes stop_codon:yes gene_type:complete
MIWNEILCLGDSITFGARDPHKRSFPAELGKMLTEQFNEFYYCHNCGINGETSSDLQKRAWGNIQSHSNSKIMLLLIGTNDTQIGIPEDIFEDNIRQIVSIAKVFGMYTIVGTLPELGFTPLYLENTKLIKEYNKRIKKLSKEMKFDICDLSGTEKHYVDGVHFTHEGNLEIANRFRESILRAQR